MIEDNAITSTIIRMIIIIINLKKNIKESNINKNKRRKGKDYDDNDGNDDNDNDDNIMITMMT